MEDNTNTNNQTITNDEVQNIQPTKISEEDFARFESILNKRNEGTAKSVAKNFAGDEEANSFLEAFAEYRKSKEPNVEAMTAKIATLEKQLRDREVSDAIAEAARTANLSDKGVKLLKTINQDTTSLFDKKGSVLVEEVTKLITSFCEDYPEFIMKQEQNNLFPTGGKQQEKDTKKEISTEDLFAQYMSFGK